MSVDRPISLETAIARQGSRMAETGGQASGQQPNDADRRAFEQALAQPDQSASSEEMTRSGPFSLLGDTPVRETLSGETAAGEISLLLSETAQRLFVGNGNTSSRQVRVELGDDVLPGVSVAVYEEEGRVVAHFICTVERSRERLEASALSMAGELAERLNRAVRVCVSADDVEDPCTRQVDAEPQAPNQDKRNAP